VVKRNEPATQSQAERRLVEDTVHSLASEGRWTEARALWEAEQPPVRVETRTRQDGTTYQRCVGALIPPLPAALDWQRDPAVPPPPGYVRVRCHCLRTVARPPDWRGRAEGQTVRPSFTVGSVCDRCGGRYVEGWGPHPDPVYLDPPEWLDPAERERTNFVARRVDTKPEPETRLIRPDLPDMLDPDRRRLPIRDVPTRHL
jgi:hypothetical protein